MSKTNKELVSELTVAYISSWEHSKITLTTTNVTSVFNTFKKFRLRQVNSLNSSTCHLFKKTYHSQWIIFVHEE